jgi:hypothetical protein
MQWSIWGQSTDNAREKAVFVAKFRETDSKLVLGKSEYATRAVAHRME